MMKRLRHPVGGLAALVMLYALSGCQETKQVIGRLPPPLAPSVTIHPETRLPPAPVPPPPTPPPPRQLVRGVVVIDPGHGGNDPGTWPRGISALPEEAINLDIGVQVAHHLTQRGVRVVMTRGSDTYVSLDRRADIADRALANLFVSIHADSAHRKSASGLTVHIHTRATTTSQKAARCILESCRRAGIETRGMLTNNFHVLREHERPAVLIECGFLTNREDAIRLNSSSYRATLATVIAEGIANFLSQ